MVRLTIVLAALNLARMAAEEAKGDGEIRIPAAPSYEIEIDGTANDLLLHDIDGDGLLDLFVAASRGGSDGPSYLFLSKGGKFEKPAWISGDLGVSAGIALGDMDGDGGLDLLIVRYNHQPAVAYRNLGKGRFEAKPFWKSADTQSAYQALVADFDGDGLPDILASGGIFELRVYRGLKGGPSREIGWELPERWWSVHRFRWVDLDRDGKRDLVVTHGMGPPVAVFRGRAKDFELTASQVIGEPGEFTGLAVGDLDGDEYPEIAVGATARRMGDGRVRLYGNRKGKVIEDPVWMSDDVDATPIELLLHDFDRDGDLDLLVVSGDHSAIYENLHGALELHPSWRGSIEGGRTVVADLDRNGFPDLVSGGKGKITVYLGGPEVPLTKPDPFPPIPELPALGSEGSAGVVDLLGIRLTPITPELKTRYGLPDSKGALVLATPPGVPWRFEIGNLREGDVFLGVGSLGEYGNVVEPAADPSKFLELLLLFSKEGDAHLAGVQWRCGPLHPSCKGEVRRERFRMKDEDWAALSGEETGKGKKSELIPLEGTIVVTDPEGKEHAEEDGSFAFILWSEGGGESRPVKVVKGKWRTAIPTGFQLGLDRIILGGKAAVSTGNKGEERIPIPEGRKLALRAAWPYPSILRVFDAETQKDLAGLEVVTDLPWPMEEFLHPGNFPEKAILLSEARSPIDLDATKDQRNPHWLKTYFIRSPGFAWGRIASVFDKGGEYRLTLQRGGEVEIRVTNFKPESKGRLRLRERKPSDPEPRASKVEDERDLFGGAEEVATYLKLHGRPVLEVVPDANGPTRIESLLPGSYVASVEIGSMFKEPEVLGSTEFLLRAGEKNAISLELRDPAARGEPVPLEGTIFVPPAWGRKPPWIHLEPLDRPDTKDLEDGSGSDRVKVSPVSKEPGLYPWSAGEVIPGKYLATIYEFHYQQVITVGPEGEKHAKIAIGEPIEVSIEILDDATSQPAEVEAIHWSCTHPDGSHSSGASAGRRNPTNGRFEFRAPAGEIEVGFLGTEYCWAHEKIPLRGPRVERTLRLTRACGVSIKFLDGEAPIPLAWEVHKVSLKRLDGKEGESGFSEGKGMAFIFTVAEPGLYEISIKEIEGYEPVPPQRVEIKAREFTEVAVSLKRKK